MQAGTSLRPFTDAAVARAFAAYPNAMRRKLMGLRELIFDTAAGIDGAGEIDETLKWGEPAYLTSQSKSGSTIRLGWKKSSPLQYVMYFHCQTTLVETFRTMFPKDFQFEGNRAIVFGEHDVVPVDALSVCIAAALTYHRKTRLGLTPSPSGRGQGAKRGFRAACGEPAERGRLASRPAHCK